MAEPFLRIPPFPGHRAPPLSLPSPGANSEGAESEDTDALIAALAGARVGGAFWAARPPLPAGRDILLAPDSQAQASRMLAAAVVDGVAARAVLIGPYSSFAAGDRHPVPVIAPLADPWHLVAHASEIRAGAQNQLALVAALAGQRPKLDGPGRYLGLSDPDSPLEQALREVIASQLLADLTWRDPFTGQAVPARQIVAMLAEWKALIDANRPIVAVFGVARWKRVTMDALLWNGSGVPYAGASDALNLPKGSLALAWKSRTPTALLAGLAARGVAVGELEDGMIRSAGLGANCVPPLSVIVDPLGPHFDPAQPSTLENILQHDEISPALIARARRLRRRLVEAGISKYGQAKMAEDCRLIERPPGSRRQVLVTGQVEDDRAMLLGGAGCTNRDLLARARAAEPDADIIYKPHPDVEAGHRRGAIPDAEVLALANRIERHAAIGTLLAQVDGIHVISSLAGFEALCRGVAVTTHGIPFFAGWGLTCDLGPVPARRNRRRSLDELIVAVLILYPRYLDPLTRLPCPPEVLVERLAAGQAVVRSPLIKLREIQGRLQGWAGGLRPR
jgi:capsular polysaccharide export protein